MGLGVLLSVVKYAILLLSRHPIGVLWYKSTSFLFIYRYTYAHTHTYIYIYIYIYIYTCNIINV